MKLFLILMGLFFHGIVRSETIEIAFVGDVNLTSRIDDAIQKYGTGWPFENIKKDLSRADYRVANLESPAGMGGEKYCDKRVYFKTDPTSLDALKDADFNLVSLANNHALDYGPDILRQTEKELKNRGIDSVGVVSSISEDSTFVIKEIRGVRFGFLAYCSVCPKEFAPAINKLGISTGDPDRVIREIKKLKLLVDFVIVLPHWGGEYQAVDINQRSFAKRALKAGADVIVGAHPHVLQKIEQKQDGKIIAYSLGNFVFPMRWEVSMDSAILFVEFQKNPRKISYRYVPIELNTNRPKEATSAGRQLRVLLLLSDGLDFSSDRKWREDELAN